MGKITTKNTPTPVKRTSYITITLIDFTKARNENQTHIGILYEYGLSNLKPHKTKRNNTVCFSDGFNRFRLEFQKVFYRGKFEGFRHVDFCFSPHYIFNRDLHNGNDLKIIDCIKTIKNSFNKLGFTEEDLSHFKIINVEYGLNILIDRPIQNIIDGILFTSTKKFKTNRYSTNKISDTTKYKEIKAYGKGAQFLNFPQYKIHPDTFRFEVRSKESKNINKLGIETISDLLKIDVYKNLFQSIINEWEMVVILNDTDEVCLNKWNNYARIRNKLNDEKKKYYNNLERNYNMHHLIKCAIIDKINEISENAFSTEEMPINTEEA